VAQQFSGLQAVVQLGHLATLHRGHDGKILEMVDQVVNGAEHSGNNGLRGIHQRRTVVNGREQSAS
jgi:hypothetical protein